MNWIEKDSYESLMIAVGSMVTGIYTGFDTISLQKWICNYV